MSKNSGQLPLGQYLLQSHTKLLEKVSPIMSTFPRNKTISKATPLRKENPFPQFNVASYKRQGIRLSFEYTTLLSGEGGEGRTGTATTFRKMLPKYAIIFYCPRLQLKLAHRAGCKPCIEHIWESQITHLQEADSHQDKAV